MTAGRIAALNKALAAYGPGPEEQRRGVVAALAALVEIFAEPVRESVREEVERELPRLPLSYFAEQLTIPSGWDTRPGAYLAFGETYAPELADAKGRGWPVRTLPGEHLHMLIDPAQVATEITSLLP